MKHFNKGICDRFSEILLSTQGDDDLVISYDKDTIDVVGNEGRLYIKIFMNELQIPYIVFKNRRVGTGTAILDECKKVCKELSLDKIKILGVMSEEMEMFCNKYNFVKLKDNGFGFYDYELIVNGCDYMDFKEYIFHESLLTYYLDGNVLIHEEDDYIIVVDKTGKISKKHISEFSGSLDDSISVLPISFFDGGFFIPYVQGDDLKVLEYVNNGFNVINLLNIEYEFGSAFDCDCNSIISNKKESIFSFELDSGDCRNGAVYRKEDGSYSVWYD